MQSVEFLEKIWHLLIAHGAVCKKQEWNDEPDPIAYYSGGFNADRKATEEAFKDMVKFGIDYEKCSDIKDGTDAAFTDTFHDSIQVPYLMGTLVTKNGKSYHWGTKSSAITLPMMMKILSSGRTLKDSIASLRARLYSSDERSFVHTCTIEG